uniref:C3H1-type domain-containing protein n=1 Tax=Oryza rufipogon TaxID=4529 RepID=A0A0E0QYL6_ORYRU
MAAAAAAADDDDHRTALPREEDDGEEEEEVESDDEEEEEGEGDGWSEEEDDPEGASLADICDPDAGSDDDPAADRDLEVDAVLRSRMARMSLSSARKDRKGSRMPKMGKDEMDLLAMVDKLMHDGQLEKLKVYECKAYLRMHKLRLSGNKEVLLTRIREHIEKKGAPRGVKGHLCGQRTNAGRIIKESYGTKKQQHTFTGYKPWPPLHPLLIKGRNLYKDKTMRQPWLDEEERNRALQEKHARGYVARKTREVRIKEKENERMRRLNRNKENKSKGQDSMNKKSSQEVLPQHTVTMNTVQKRAEKIIPSLQHGESGNSSQQHLSSKQTPTEQLLHYLPQFPHPQQHNEVLLQKGTSRTSTAQLTNHQAPSLQHAVKAETTQQQQQLPKSIKPAPIQQSSAYPQQYPKNQHHNQELPRVPPSQEQRAAVSQTSAARQDFTNHKAPPSRQHGGSENMRRQEISSRPTLTPTPQQAVSYTQQQPPNHQYRNEAFRQQGGTSTSGTGFMDRQSNNWGSTDHDKPAFQPRMTFTQKAKTYQHGSNGSGHHQARVDRETHQPLRSRNQDYYWEDQSYHHQQNHHQNYYYGHRQMSQDQYHHQQNHHQNYNGRQGMNRNQYHDRQNQNPQRFRPWKPCFIYQQQGWCPYGENCKFVHDLR